MLTDQDLRNVAEAIAKCAMGDPEDGGYYFVDADEIDDLGSLGQPTRRAINILRSLLDMKEWA